MYFIKLQEDGRHYFRAINQNLQPPSILILPRATWLVYSGGRMKRILLGLLLLFFLFNKNSSLSLQASERTWKEYWKPQVGMTYRDWHIMRDEASGTWSNCVFLTCDYTYKKGETAYYKLKSNWEKFDPEILRSSNNWVGNLNFNNLNRNDVSCGEYLEKCEQILKNLFSSNKYNDLRDIIIFRTLNERNIYYFFQINNKNVLDSKLIKIADQSYLDVVVKETQNQLAIEAANLKKQKEKEAEKDRLASLEKLYGKNCSKFSGNNNEFNNCLLEKDKISKAAERKQLEAEQAKRKTIEDKQKEEANKLAKMSPDDRRAFTCSDKFGFRKGSDKFKDCVFKIYQAELELEKLELQRELAKANAETARVRAEAAKASEERQQNLARAQTEAATMQALAARQQAIAANTASSLQMIESGLRMMSPQQPAPRLQTNCYYHARSFSCF